MEQAALTGLQIWKTMNGHISSAAGEKFNSQITCHPILSIHLAPDPTQEAGAWRADQNLVRDAAVPDDTRALASCAV